MRNYGFMIRNYGNPVILQTTIKYFSPISYQKEGISRLIQRDLSQIK